MSGPYCETCKHFLKTPFGENGECHDPDKIIYASYGSPINAPPEVWPRFECSNWQPLPAPPKEGK